MTPKPQFFDGDYPALLAAARMMEKENGMQTKDFSTPVVVCTATDISFGNGMTISMLHECVAWVLGYDVFTHELGIKAVTGRAADLLREQYPDLPSREQAERPDRLRFLSEFEKSHGFVVPVTRGSDVRERHPLDTLTDVVRPRALASIIVVAT
jgi:hypothetical protein